MQTQLGSTYRSRVPRFSRPAGRPVSTFPVKGAGYWSSHSTGLQQVTKGLRVYFAKAQKNLGSCHRSESVCARPQLVKRLAYSMAA